MTKSFLVTVLMPVFNAEDFILESIESILRQSFNDIELIIIDDASTDRTLERISKLRDSRIVLLQNDQNQGLAASLNIAISNASGDYLARMDADDISHPRRIEMQVKKFMDSNEISVLGTGLHYFGTSRFRNFFPSDHDRCKARLLFNVCFGHPSIMMRKEIFNSRLNLYDPSLEQYSEDYDLYSRLVDQYKFGNLNSLLLKYRTYEKSEKNLAESLRRKNSSRIRARMLQMMGIPKDNIDLQTHTAASDFTPLDSVEQFEKIGEWFQYITEVNRETGYFHRNSLNMELTNQYFEVANHNLRLDIKLSSMNQFAFFNPRLLSFSSEVRYLMKRKLALV